MDTRAAAGICARTPFVSSRPGERPPGPRRVDPVSDSAHNRSVRGRFRRDLELAPGTGFRLRRRLAARVFSALLAIAGLAWGVFDLWIGYRWVGLATLALAAAFVVQLAQAELDSWRFERGEAVRRFFALRPPGVREERLAARQLKAVHVASGEGVARAWIETRTGEEYALVEGKEDEVRRIAERLSGSLRLASMDRRHDSMH
jgi:hypothetical protein